MRWIQGRHVAHLDFHTGLGKYGSCKLLVPAGCDPQQLQRCSTLFRSSEIEVAFLPHLIGDTVGESHAFPDRGPKSCWQISRPK